MGSVDVRSDPTLQLTTKSGRALRGAHFSRFIMTAIVKPRFADT
ncbi:hypothetical protein EGR_03705 [Echinococcus granulosus]|uniref:Uncharacterized protein n=1 Tax=Echinococcus granulosus TaxID=6210 RepID=W6UIT1_ECHGR|nr:hypothetical protein EGR_03705 [Echinococcus granulosus]EUB61415.1 hypothetical protein EGR_03705 [Echinococcus granulosus]